MGHILDLAERYLAGRVPRAQHNPMLPLMQLEDLGKGLAFVSSFANVTALATEDGLVLFDTGSFFLSAQVFAALRTWTQRRLNTAVFTHGHVDHCFGVEQWEADARDHKWPKPTVVAHEAVPARFERYQLTQGYNACINSRQFSQSVQFPRDFRAPDVLYRDALTLDVGGARIELHHARGETDDHTWAWLPEHRAVATGDLFIWCSPNAGNPQKVQRYPREWARALRAMSALDPEILLPGHGLPITGAARVKRALDETASLLEAIVDQVLALMNEGATLDTVIHSVRFPEELLDRPYLRPVYDEPEFIVRNVWRLYGGWWDGNPAHLKPAPERDVAVELATLAGGAKRLADRALALVEEGDLRLACHLVELAGRAAPDDAGIRHVRARVYRLRAEREDSLMAKGIYGAAAKD